MYLGAAVFSVTQEFSKVYFQLWIAVNKHLVLWWLKV